MKKRIIALPLLLLVMVAFCTMDNGAWTLIPSTNTPPSRNECGFAAVKGKIYLVGGDAPAQPVGIYDPATSSWTKGAMAPSIMHHFQAVGLGDKVYVLDAFSDRNYPNQVPLANAYAYDTKTDNWQALAGLPEGRRRGGAGAAVHNGKLYLVCGILHGHHDGTNGLFDEYDPKANTWTSLPDAPHIRDHSMAVVVKDKLYAIGGRNTSLHDAGNFMSFFDKVVLDVDCYDFKTGKWSTLPAKLPMGTGGGNCVNLDGKIFYIGGERATGTKPNGPQTDVFYLDPETDTQWHPAPSLNKARNGVGAAVYNHHIYIAGGASGDIGLERFGWQ
ncbi:kelch repeat-containing protein [Mucilaginibacter sp. dw_454]|uniref:Kelch repeat-containing protein n=1 Tax=Mucilaginibacter sp. dw_454 TaxID=2720079 RepID=UPI001BD35D67|nr:kelch repeat-containing protein [Mucilaginibacter sp. dw_454]